MLSVISVKFILLTLQTNFGQACDAVSQDFVIHLDIDHPPVKIF